MKLFARQRGLKQKIGHDEIFDFSPKLLAEIILEHRSLHEGEGKRIPAPNLHQRSLDKGELGHILTVHLRP